MKIKILFIFLALCLCCNSAMGENQETKSTIQIKGSLSESEFKKAIIGTWKAVWNHPEKENIKYLELKRDGLAKIIIQNKQEIEGNYVVNFLSGHTKGIVTFAEIIIKASQSEIVLSRVSFGHHSALPMNRGPFLRVDTEPFGVLEKSDN
jgi:hypothetical protein